ncbi:MAG: GntR family transcriptional regulator [Ktedonobacteraceae bacterium]
MIMVLSTVDRLSLRERVLQELRDGILSGRLPVGTRLLEVKISKVLGVSRGTVREAFRHLQEEGLLTSESRGSIYVRVLSPREVREIYAVRAALEGLAAQYVAGRRDRETAVETLRLALQGFEATPTPSFSELLKVDLDFHQLLCTLSENATLLDMWQRLSGLIRAALISAGPYLVMPLQTISHHTEMVNAIAQGDGPAARLALETYLEESALILVSAMEKVEK